MEQAGRRQNQHHGDRDCARRPGVIAEQAMLAAEAVCAGGITIVEITMTVPGAIDVIAASAKSMGSEVLIGAGTVLDAESAQRCIDAGAEFVVSPGFDLRKP